MFNLSEVNRRWSTVWLSRRVKPIDVEHIMEPKWYILGDLLPHYSVPANIGRVSLGQDYRGVWFIDEANEDDPLWVWCYDTWDKKQIYP